MADSKLKFFNKQGNPLNFDYIGPTGPTPLDARFTYITNASGAPNNGDLDITDYTTYYEFVFNEYDLNSFNLVSWYNEIAEYLSKGAEVFLNGEVIGAKSFKGKIDSITISGGQISVNLLKDYYQGQSIISVGNRISFTTTYKNRPGGHFKGNIYFDPISTSLYENEQIFIVQELYNVTASQVQYGLPHSGFTGATSGSTWRSRWYNDNYGESDVTDIIFTYSIEDQLEGGEGEPLIINYPNMTFSVDLDTSDYYANGYVNTTSVNSSSLGINVALNGSDEAESVYERKLIIDDISSGTPVKVLEIDFYGQIIGEDERFKVMLQNFGRAFYKSDSVILRDHDPDEPLPNYLEINEKRKELLVAGDEIFPYMGSYKGLINAIKFFGYQDLRIKEYWLNLNYNTISNESPIQKNKQFLDVIRAQQKQGYTMSYQVGDVLDNENSGKYRLVQTYGPNADGEYVLDVSSAETLIPSRTYKKTSLFGLYYDLNKVTDEFDEYGFPVVVDAFKFTQEEVLLKIFALKERLKRDYLPLNAKIVDITGEGVYFTVYNTRSWADIMERFDIESGFNFDFYPNPDFGFLEDLRNFSIRPQIDNLQSPSSYNNYYIASVDFIGGTGSAVSFTGDFPCGFTGPNPTITINAGKTYQFDIIDSGDYDYNFIITTNPSYTQVDPLGIQNNGATGGESIIWYVDPEQTGTMYYYSSANGPLMSGTINILPSTISDLGNIIDPLDSQQIHTAAQNVSLITAIENFYYLKQNGKILELGDGKYDPSAYVDPATGELYQTPLGMPVILELIPDIWTWDEMDTSWSSIIIPAFKTGDSVQIKSAGTYFGVFGTVTAVNYSTGQYSVFLDPPYSTTVSFDESDLYSTNQQYLLLTWGNIDFSNMMEIEWILNKSATQSGTPYYFEFRGSIADFNKLAHFIPHTGEYRVTCNVYDAFNFKNVVIKDAIIKVQPKVIDIDSWTRYREVEFYEWENVDKSWKDYNSIWEYPAEGESIEVLQKKIPSEILKFATYGNKAEEGQSVLVKTELDPIGATGGIIFTQSIINISEIYSLEIFAGQYGPATILTASPHGLSNGDEVTIMGSISQINGRWIAGVTGSTNIFKIQTYIDNSMSGVVSLASPTRYSVDGTAYPNQKITGAGSISIEVGGREIGYSECGDSLYHTANYITSAVNKLVTYPDYHASCTDPTEDPVTVTIYATDSLGAEQNGVSLNPTLTGSLSLVSASAGLTGGVSPLETYVEWSENSSEYPNDNLKYWGTKNLDWQIFNEATWEEGYAHSWYDFEFNNDWLGGYEIHSIIPGDYLKISTGNTTFPFPTGITFSNSATTLQDVADELNNSLDSHLTNFWYRPIPSDVGSLSTLNPPINVSIATIGVSGSTAPAPPSAIGGSSLLIPGFGYTGPTGP